MPVPKISDALDAVNGILYTGASTAAWTLDVWEYHPTLGKIYQVGSWDNATTTYTDGPDVGKGSPSVYLFIFSGGAVCDILVDDVITINPLTVFHATFTVDMPTILPSMFDKSDEFWMIIEGISVVRTFNVPFEPKRSSDLIIDYVAFLSTQGKVLSDRQSASDQIETEGYNTGVDTVVFSETTRIGGGLLVHHEEVVRLTELRIPSNWTEIVETLTSSELIYKHGDESVAGRSGPGDPGLVNLVLFAYDSLSTTETLEKAGAESDDEGGVSWYVEIIDPLGSSEAVTFNNQADPAIDIVSDIFDFKANGIKSLEWVHIDWNMDASNPMSVAIDYRYASSDAWTRSAFVELNDANLAYIGLAGIEFRLVLTAEAYASITPNGPVTVTYKQIDKRGIRGINAN
jgi:hypothetical protein